MLFLNVNIPVDRRNFRDRSNPLESMSAEEVMDVFGFIPKLSYT